MWYPRHHSIIDTAVLVILLILLRMILSNDKPRAQQWQTPSFSSMPPPPPFPLGQPAGVWPAGGGSKGMRPLGGVDRSGAPIPVTPTQAHLLAGSGFRVSGFGGEMLY